VDFYCPEKSTVVEVDSDTHADESQRVQDEQREDYLKSLGLQVIRYTNQEILKNLDGVLEDLWGRMSVGSTSPHPSLQRRGMSKSLLTKEGR
jgi:very-short-patch-repair endonuclease